MQFKAHAKHLQFSPFKLRLVVDQIRGRNVKYALHWLSSLALKKAVPVAKVIASAAANAKHNGGVDEADLVVQEIRVDHGRMFKYYTPASMGRAAIQRRRFSHISVVLKSIKQQQKEA